MIEADDERFAETERFLRMARERLGREGLGNLEWVETGLKAALNADACGLLGKLLADTQIVVEADEKGPGEKRGGVHEKKVVSLFGEVCVRRNYYYDPKAKKGRYPMDAALGLENGYTPGVVRLICRAAARDSYQAASDDLKAYAGLDVSSRQINRMARRMGPGMRAQLEQESAAAHTASVPRMYVSCDGTGIPMRKAELESTPAKNQNGEKEPQAKTKEVKVGCVFTQHPRDGEEPFRDIDSTSYIATLRRCHQFGPLLRKEAYRRGMGRAGEVVFIADGAAWIWEVVRSCFPGALQILDYYHAREYLSAIILLLFGKDSPPGAGARQLERWKKMLFEDKVGTVVKQMRRHARKAALSAEDWKTLEGKIGYIENNSHRMLYGTYKREGYFYGSGVVEAGCKSVIGKRAKQSGMFWSTPGAEDVLTMRAALHSNRFDAYWDQKHAA